MNRHNLPLLCAEQDMPAQITEIRLPERSEAHDMRNREEARP